MFCANCGKDVQQNIKFCPYCGTCVENPTENSETSQGQSAEQAVLDNLQAKEKVSVYIWIGIVCFQVLIGFEMPSAWGFAVWNAIACYQNYQFMDQMKRHPVGIFKHYEDALIEDLIFLVLNLVLGGVIGAVGAGYDLYVRQYAMDNKEILLQIENKYTTGGEENG